MVQGVCCAYADIDLALDTILGRFAHAPNLRLTRAQACRLWGLDDTRCQGMFDALVDAGYLRLGSDGAYMLAQ